VSVRRGLPEAIKSRHEKHYVDSLSAPLPNPIGREIPVNEIEPNAEQPRTALGDLSGLKKSIEEKGIIEPIIVRRVGERFQIISGERRFVAARELGIDTIPCIIRDADDLETLEVALIENLQRKDLTPFEEADGLQQLRDKYGYTHDDIANKIGKSRSSITETMSLSRIPEDIRRLCTSHGVNAKSMLLQIARQDTSADMLRLTQSIVSKGITREEARATRPHLKSEKPKPATFRFKARGKPYTVTVKFKKTEASREEIIEALRCAIAELQGDPDNKRGVGTPTDQG
jgi:ParB family chromosome partitioning protein